MQLWQAAKKLFTPDLKRILEDSVLDAELELLRAHSTYERAAAELQCCKQRLSRLKAQKENFDG